MQTLFNATSDLVLSNMTRRNLFLLLWNKDCNDDEDDNDSDNENDNNNNGRRNI